MIGGAGNPVAYLPRLTDQLTLHQERRAPAPISNRRVRAYAAFDLQSESRAPDQLYALHRVGVN